MAWLSGVEISSTFAGTTVHIVGLDSTPRRTTPSWRPCAPRAVAATDRAHEMSDGLARAGIHGAFDGALKYVGNPELISRTHFARHLVDSGVCRDTSEVFRNYLIEGKPGYVAHRWASLGDSVRWITQAGGMAVIAHPGRYKFTPNEEYALFSEFKTHGGRGVEVITGSHTEADFRNTKHRQPRRSSTTVCVARRRFSTALTRATSTSARACAAEEPEPRVGGP